MQVEKKMQLPDPDTIGEKVPGVVKYLKDLNEIIFRYTLKLADVLNRGLRITDNFDATIATVDFTNANTEYEISHATKRVPVGFLVIDINKNAIIYSSGTPFTTTSIYLKSDTANTSVKLLIV